MQAMSRILGVPRKRLDEVMVQATILQQVRPPKPIVAPKPKRSKRRVK